MSNVLFPARQVCPLCSRDDLKITALGPALWRYTCSNEGRHGNQGVISWDGSETDRLALPEGKAADLGLYEDLPRCLFPGEGFVEYGVVEHRYSERCPRLYEQLLQDYSHTRIERNKPYTASVFIALALGRLADRGEVLYQVGLATGYWSYNGVISYWALPSGSTDWEQTTWLKYATSRGLDPNA
jgi:hypothetical protein